MVAKRAIRAVVCVCSGPCKLHETTTVECSVVLHHGLRPIEGAISASLLFCMTDFLQESQTSGFNVNLSKKSGLPLRVYESIFAEDAIEMNMTNSVDAVGCGLPCTGEVLQTRPRKQLSEFSSA